MTHPEASEIRALYLELLKRSLTGALAEDNDSVLGGVRTQGTSDRIAKRLANRAGMVAQRFGFEVALKKPYDPKLREVGWTGPSRAESMIGLRRLDNVQAASSTIVADGVPGDLIETGVWRGGA